MKNYIAKVNSGFLLKEKEGVQVFTIPMFLENGFVKHCFTSRNGGVSKDEFNSLNLSKTREKNSENKKENYRRVCNTIGVSYETVTLVNYSHGDGIVVATKEDAGKGISRDSDFSFCDAMITAEEGVCAHTLHADCVPVFVADINKRVVCVAHAGWKGVLAELPKKIINKFYEEFSSDPQDVIVGIGPHIRKWCFEVGEDVYMPFVERFGEEIATKVDGKIFLDLEYAILMQLKESKILASNVTCAKLCTYCETRMFYSHRRDKGKTGAMGSFIAL